MTLSKQTGFSVAAIIGLIVVISGLGFIGWRVYDSVQEKKDQTESVSQPEPQAKPNSNKIQIKELGIEITVPDSLKDLTYSIREVEDGFKVATISTASLTSKDLSCGASEGAPFGALAKREGEYESGLSQVLVKQFKGSYITYAPPQAVCSVDDSVVESGEAARKEFTNSFSTIVEISQ